MRVTTVGHGTRPAAELVACLEAAGVETLAAAGIAYRHAVELGGRRSGEPGADRFACIATPGFRSYAAWMGTSAWQEALAGALAEPGPCLMCAETLPWRCHRWLIAELLLARGYEVLHLFRPGDARRHRLSDDSEVRAGRLYLCGELVA